MRECLDAAPKRVAFPAFGLVIFQLRCSSGSPRSPVSSIPAPNVHLPRVNLRCSIRDAYQAADAGHPDMGRASSPRSKHISPGSSVHNRLCAAKAQIGKDIT